MSVLGRAVLIGLVALTIGAPAQATTTFPTDVRCPVCGAKTTAFEINSFTTAGREPDFCPIHLGEPPFMVSPTTCSSCWYSASSDGFIRPADPSSGPKLGPDVKARIKSGAALAPAIPIPAGTPSPNIPAWVRLDLVARTLELTGASNLAVGDAYLRASWAVRSECSVDLTDADLPTEYGVGFDDWLREHHPAAKNPQWYRERTPLDEAEHFVALAATGLPDRERRFAVIAALPTFRRLGEHERCLQTLAKLEPLVPPGAYAALRTAYVAWIDRERHFQRKALACFERYLATATKDDEDMPTFQYLVGELHRRLGNRMQARIAFLRARSLTTSPERSDLRALIERQEALVPTSWLY